MPEIRVRALFSPCYTSVKTTSFLKNKSQKFANKVHADILIKAVPRFDPGTHRFPYGHLFCYTTIHGAHLKIKFISTQNIIVRKLDYITSEEPVDLFLTTLLVCTRQQ